MAKFNPEYQKTFKMAHGTLVSHQMDAHGWHRLVIFDQPSEGDAFLGEASSYQGIASVQMNERTFIAATAYYEGELPIEQPLEVCCGDIEATGQPKTKKKR